MATWDQLTIMTATNIQDSFLGRFPREEQGLEELDLHQTCVTC